MQVFYRFSDGGQSSPNGSSQNKLRPDGFDKRLLLIKFLETPSTISFEVTLFADNVSDETYQFLTNYKDRNDRLVKLIRLNNKSGAYTFLNAAHYAFNSQNSQNIYFVEDDYQHWGDWVAILAEGLAVADYVTLYDHPDKYIIGHNPLVKTQGVKSATGEETSVFLSKSCHWKLTNSTTMTFATTLDRLREDYAIYVKHCKTGYPFDYDMFRELITQKGRTLISSIPAYSTHLENGVLAPFSGKKPL